MAHDANVGCSQTGGESGVMKNARAFTLIEILVVVAIIGLLISIVMPSLAAARRTSKKTKCAHNLHQIGVGMEAYLNVSRDIFPAMASLPSNESNVALIEGGRDPYDAMSVVLKKELGGKSEVFECPADEIGEDTAGLRAIGLYAGNRYYGTETTSYEWNVFLNPDYDSETNTMGPPKHRRHKRIGILGSQIRFSLANLQMMYGFEPFHGTASRSRLNSLYADLHVDSQ